MSGHIKDIHPLSLPCLNKRVADICSRDLVQIWNHIFVVGLYS